MSTFKRGDYVRKKSGAFWEGDVVGDYSTDQTQDGVNVRLFGWADGPVQIYPDAALELCRREDGRIAEARSKALEDAAKVADESAEDFKRQAATKGDSWEHDALFMAADACDLTAEDIRALKDKP